MKVLKITASILSISLLFACGSNSEQKEATEEVKITSAEMMKEEASSSKEESKSKESKVIEITIEADDQMQYNKDEFIYSS